MFIAVYLFDHTVYLMLLCTSLCLQCYECGKGERGGDCYNRVTSFTSASEKSKPHNPAQYFIYSSQSRVQTPRPPHPLGMLAQIKMLECGK